MVAGGAGLALALGSLAGTAAGVFALLADSTQTGQVAIASAPLPSTLVGSIGDRVWSDLDHDGVQGATEPGLGGVTVTLLASDGATPASDGDGVVVDPVVTTPDGTYQFSGLHEGSYVVAFADLPGVLTEQGSDPEDGTDSDPDPTSGMTPPFTLVPGQALRTVDAGVWVPAPALTLETRVQGQDADVEPGPSLPIGSAATFDYVVTNTGNEPLVDVHVADSSGAAIDCPHVALARLATLTCSRVEPVAAGSRTVVGTASATGARSGGGVSATDPAHLFGVEPLLDVTLTADGQDADSTASAVVVDAGDEVALVLSVRNVALERVAGIEVTLDGGPIACPTANLAPGSSVDCPVAAMTAEPGPRTAVAAAAGTGELSGVAAADSDPASWFGRAPGLSVLKTVFDPATAAYLDADADAGSPGSNDGRAAAVEAGQTARYRFLMSNTGNVALPDAEVVDPHCDEEPELVSGDPSGPGVLDVGETWHLRCVRDAVTVGFTNEATAEAGGLTATERARVEVVGGAPSVALDKAVQREDGTFGEDATVDVGGSATFRIEVRNTGERPLVDLRVVDPQATGCDRVIPGPLAPGATAPAWTCTEVVTSGHTNSAQVSAVPLGGGAPVTDRDTATVHVEVPGSGNLVLDKTLVDSTSTSARWSLRVTNEGTGDVAGPITVTDRLPDQLAFVSAAGPGFVCAPSGSTVVCTHAAGMTSGTSVEIDLVTSVRPGTSGGPVVNTAEVAASGGEAVDADDRDTATFVVEGPEIDRREDLPTVPSTGLDLPLTGLDVGGLVVAGVCLAGIGLLLVWAARRRRAAEADEPELRGTRGDSASRGVAPDRHGSSS
jgi:hypothetical protein